MHYRLDRPLRDLRISVTDRCNFRCPYCMPRSRSARATVPARERAAELRRDRRLAGVFVALGVTKIRLTGGEPLLRRDLVSSWTLAMLAASRTSRSPPTARCSRARRALCGAGLTGVTVSLDSLDPDVSRDERRGFPVARGAGGDRGRPAAGPSPIKINCVVRRGVNETSILRLVISRSRGRSCVSSSTWTSAPNGWRREDVVTAEEILDRGPEPTRWSRKPGSQAMSPAATASPTAAARSVSSPRSPGPSAATAPAPGWARTAGSTPACSRSRGIDLRGPLRDGAADAELSRLVSTRGNAAPTAIRGRPPSPLAATHRDVLHRRMTGAGQAGIRGSSRALGA